MFYCNDVTTEKACGEVGKRGKQKRPHYAALKNMGEA